MFCSHRLEVGALDGEAEGKGETDEEAKATGCGGSVNRETVMGAAVRSLGLWESLIDGHRPFRD
jgi:hypothetical protein